MKKLMGILILVTLCVPMLIQQVSAAEGQGFGTVDVSVEYYYDDANHPGHSENGKAYGRYQSFSAQESSGYEFAMWVVNGVARPDLPENMQVKVTSNMHLVALYKPVDHYGVLFIDSNGQVISSKFVGAGDNVTAPAEGLPSKPGLVIKSEGAWKTADGITSLENIQEDRVYELQYENASSAEYTLTIDGGEGVLYSFNELVTVVADAQANGADFAYWAIDGKPVSCDLEYSFTMVGDLNLEKVYDSAATSEPILMMSSDLEIRDGYQTYMGQFYLPASYEIIEYGFKYSEDNTSDLMDESSTMARANQHNEASNEYVMSFPVGSFGAISAYMTYEDAEGNISSMMSDHIDRYEAVASGYSTDFEDSPSKTSYGAGVITIAGVDWNLNEALVSTSSSESNSGTKAIRLDDDPGYMESQSSFDYISLISFSAKYYSSDGNNEIEVYVSSDATNWVLVSDAVEGGILCGSEYVAYAMDLDNSPSFKSSGLGHEDLYVRIFNPSGFGRRVNIDDLMIASGGSMTPVYRVSFIDDSNTSFEMVSNGNYASAPVVAEREGYEFAGWYYDEAFTSPVDFDNDEILSDTIMYANWNVLEQFSVDYYSLSSDESAFYSENVYDGNLAFGPDSDPVRDGYNFAGWYLDDVIFENQFDLDNAVTENTVVYAKWVDSSVVVSETFVETMTQFPETSSSYEDGSYVGDNNITWNYVDCRGDSNADKIDGEGMMFRSSTGSVSANLTGGISSFSVDIISGYTSGSASDRGVSVYVNDILIGSYKLTAMGTIETFEINDINVQGNYTLRIDVNGSKQTIIDNISWTTLGE